MKLCAARTPCGEPVKLELLSRVNNSFNCCAALGPLESIAISESYRAFFTEEMCLGFLFFCEINLTGHNENYAVQFAQRYLKLAKCGVL